MNSFIGWIGGKKLLRNKILQEFPEDFNRYIEVFGGAGWILFAKEKHAKFEVFNDVDGDLINLYRVVKYHPEALQKELDFSLMSREQFFIAKEKQGMKGVTDVQRAAAFFLVIKESFGCALKTFGCRARDIERMIDYLSEVSRRLNEVVIEKQDFERIIKTYDRKDALFYLDPPYYAAEKYYQRNFATEDHTRLKKVLDKINGKFVLSYNDCVEIKDLYKEYNILEVDRQDNLVAKTESRRYRELIIKNY